jgi:glycosyltransferase involved in cell wall biosynthesis
VYGSKTVSIVLPAYNEEQYIRSAVEDFFSTGVVDEVLVIDNNSRDGTAREARQTRARVVAETAQGYGHALRRGLREASGDFIIMAEPDGTFVARDVLKLLAYAEDFDMVCGTRTTRELIWEQANMGWFLRVGNWWVAKMIQLLYGAPSLSDCGCTLRLTRRDALARIQDDLTIGGSHFLPQMVIAGLQRGLRIIEVPVNYRGRVGDSKITGTFEGALRTGLRMIALILGSRFEALRRRGATSYSQGGQGGHGAQGAHPVHREVGEIGDRK